MSKNTLIVIAVLLGLAIVWILFSAMTQDRPKVDLPEQDEQVQQLTPGDSSEEIDQDMQMLEGDIQLMQEEMEAEMLQMEAEMGTEFNVE
ncbi:MAG: hypothetical protein Q8P70_00520 [bacterium]|nr:hypothetical protein [bacterium]